MSDDLKYEVSVKGIQDLEKLDGVIKNLGATLGATKGSGKSLEELRKIITGLKGSKGVFEELKDSIQSLNGATANLNTGIAAGLKALNATLKREFATLGAQMQTMGTTAGQSLVKGIEGSTPEAVAAVEKHTKALKAAVKAGSVAMNNAAGEYQVFNPSTGLKGTIKNDSSAQQKAELAGFQQMNALRVASAKETADRIAQYNAQALKQSVTNSFPTLDKSYVVKSAKESAAAFVEAFAVEAARTKQLVQNQFPNLDKSYLVKSAKESAAVFNAAFAAEAKKPATMPVDKMSRMDAKDSIYKQSMSDMRAYYSGLEAGPAKTEAMGKGLRVLAKDMGDTHSMARGLASGFNLLWLTWGNLAPLFIGAAISNGFMQTVKTGLQVAHTFEVMSALGGATTKEMMALSNEMIRLGTTGVFGPLEISKAMEILTLAGLKANDVLKTTGTVMNLAMAGTTDLKTAADVLVSITTAFGTGADGFARAADIIVRAAAESKASVESIGEAMKTASVVGEQYGASMTDVGAQIALLANLGIQGSAAGTAIRNMYSDLSGRSEKVTKILKSQNLEFRQANGAMKPYLEIVQEMSGALSKLDEKSGKNLLQAILSERGAKDMVAAMVEYNKQIRDADGNLMAWSKTNNGLTAILKKIEDSYGDNIVAAKSMEQTTQNAFKGVGASIETTFFKSFQNIEPQLYMIAVSMKEAFASPAVQSALTLMVSLIANLAKALSDNAGLVLMVLGAWAGAKVASMLVGGLTASVVGYATALKGLGGAAAASAAATSASTTAVAAGAAVTATAGANALQAGSKFLGFAKAIPLVGTAISILTGLWVLYDTIFGSSMSKVEDYTNTKNGQIVEALRKEAEKLEFVNQKRWDGLSAIEAEIALKEHLQRVDNNSATQGGLSGAAAEMNQKKSQFAATTSKLNSLTGGGPELALERSKLKERAAIEQKEYNESTQRFNQFTELRARSELDLAQEQARVRAASAHDSKIKAADQLKQAAATQEEMKKILGKGTGTFSNDEGGAGGGSGRKDRQLNQANDMLEKIKASNQSFEQQLKVLEEATGKTDKFAESQDRLNLINVRLAGTLSAAARSVYEQAAVEAAAGIAIEAKIAQENRRITGLKNRIAIEKELFANEQAYAQQIAEWDKNAEREIENSRLKGVAIQEEGRMLMANISTLGMEVDAREEVMAGIRTEAALRAELARIGKIEGLPADKRAQLEKEANDQSFDTAKIEKAERAAKRLQKAFDPKDMKKWGDEGNKAFTKLVKGLETIGKSMQEYAQNSRDVATAKEAINNNTNLKDEEKSVAIKNLEGEQMKNNLGLYGDMASGAASFFDEQSSGYKTLMAVSQAFHAAEMAMTMAQQLQAGILAVLGQAQGDPYSAFVRMAAMIAFVGSLGVALGGGGGGGSSAPKDRDISADIQKASGAGTVFGDETAKSESIMNSLDLLADNSVIELTYTQKMLATLSQLKDSILSLAGATTRMGGVRGTALEKARWGVVEGSATSLVDSGLGFTPEQTIRTILEKGIQGFGYGTTFTKEDGKKASAGMNQTALSSDFTSQVSYLIQSIADTVITTANAVGLNDNSVMERILNVMPSIGDTADVKRITGRDGGGLVSLKGMSGKEVEEELNAVFSSIGDQIAMAALPALKEFQIVGEGYFETLVRVSSGIEKANVMLEKFGVTAIDYTQILSKSSDTATEIVRQSLMNQETVNGSLTGVGQILDVFVGTVDDLGDLWLSLKAVRDVMKSTGRNAIDLTAAMVRGAGGLEGLSNGFTSYLDGFFTDAEKLTAATARMREEFQRIGVAMPANNDEFRKLVESLDTSTDSGQYLTGQLMAVSQQFSDMTSMAKEAVGAIKSISDVIKEFGDLKESFLTPGELKAEAATRIKGRLAQSGVNLEFNEILGFSRQEFADKVRQFIATGNSEMLNMMLAISEDFQAISEDTVTSLSNQQTEWQNTINTLEATTDRLKQVSEGAKELSKSLSIAMGGADTSEAELWAKLNGTGPLEDRLKAAQDLKSLIEKTATTQTQKQQQELQNAQALLTFGKNLRDYVNGLKTGSLSALTPSQKMTEARGQYETTLAKSIAGDKDAQAKLQENANTYLTLAKEYDPGAYGKIFSTVTSQLSALSDSLIGRYESEVARQQALIDAATSANGLSAEQLAKMAQLQVAVNSLGALADVRLMTANAELVLANKNLFVVTTLLEKANDVWSYLPGQGETLTKMQLTMQGMGVSFDDMPAKIATALFPVIGVPNSAEQQTAELLSAVLARLESLELTTQEAAIMTAQASQNAGQQTADAVYNAQQIAARTSAGQNLASA